VWLNTEMTEELKDEGILRELIRTINQLRKEAGLTIEQTIQLEFATKEIYLKKIIHDYEAEIKKSVLASLILEISITADQQKSLVDGKELFIKFVL
jgi:isoleucyl-tRNA synthetase